MSDEEPPNSEIRALELDRDLPALKRIWREVGWVDDEQSEAQLQHFFGCGDALVATLSDEAECAVHIAPGTMRLQHTDLPLCAVTAVTTSRIARGHAFAQRLTAQQLAKAVGQGAAVSALGMFDQGFYDKVGFATGAYEHSFSIDPGTLAVDHQVPTPQRLGLDDYEAMHAAMCTRQKTHGSIVLDPPILFRAELGFEEDDFGLGYSTEGVLSHFLWLGAKGEHGPYQVRFLCYQNSEQLIVLLGLLKSLADQVYSVELTEPAEIQLQTLLRRPFRVRSLTRSSEFSNEQEADAWWQFRILDVPRCVAALSCREAVAFQLQVSDPLQAQLNSPSGWRGVAGDYEVALGPQSSAAPGRDPKLPKLRCSVAALSRLLWGIMPASSIALTEDLQAPTALLQQLDQAIVLPPAVSGWDF
ncbi:MAG: GNAT family N-acetyltransferase [Pseudomonadales bacterium]